MDSFKKFNNWLEKNILDLKFVRHYKIQNDGGEEFLVPGYGKCYMIKRGLPFMSINRTKADKKGVFKETDILEITVFSMFSGGLKRFIEDVNKIDLERENKEPSLFHAADGYWERGGKIRKVLPPVSKSGKAIVRDIRKFLDSKDDYIRKGLPFKRGYMLSGCPGGGKSSIAAYLAHHFKLDIYETSVFGINRYLLANIDSKGSIILLEDIDLTTLGKVKRSLGKQSRDPFKFERINGKIAIKGDDDDDDDGSGGGEEATYEDAVAGEVLRDVLNILDGICSYGDCIFICTTNNISVLDDALLRPGRIDKIYEITYLTPKEQLEYINLFYNTNYTKIDITEHVTIAEVANTCQYNIADDTEVLKKYKVS